MPTGATTASRGEGRERQREQIGQGRVGERAEHSDLPRQLIGRPDAADEETGHRLHVGHHLQGNDATEGRTTDKTWNTRIDQMSKPFGVVRKTLVRIRLDPGWNNEARERRFLEVKQAVVRSHAWEQNERGVVRESGSFDVVNPQALFSPTRITGQDFARKAASASQPPGAAWVKDDETFLVGLFVQAAEPHHRLGVAATAVDGQNNRNGFLAVVAR